MAVLGAPKSGVNLLTTGLKAIWDISTEYMSPNQAIADGASQGVNGTLPTVAQSVLDNTLNIVNNTQPAPTVVQPVMMVADALASPANLEGVVPSNATMSLQTALENFGIKVPTNVTNALINLPANTTNAIARINTTLPASNVTAQLESYLQPYLSKDDIRNLIAQLPAGSGIVGGLMGIMAALYAAKKSFDVTKYVANKALDGTKYLANKALSRKSMAPVAPVVGPVPGSSEQSTLVVDQPKPEQPASAVTPPTVTKTKEELENEAAKLLAERKQQVAKKEEVQSAAKPIIHQYQANVAAKIEPKVEELSAKEKELGLSEGKALEAYRDMSDVARNAFNSAMLRGNLLERFKAFDENLKVQALNKYNTNHTPKNMAKP